MFKRRCSQNIQRKIQIAPEYSNGCGENRFCGKVAALSNKLLQTETHTGASQGTFSLKRSNAPLQIQEQDLINKIEILIK